jgi:hypothetical protein
MRRAALVPRIWLASLAIQCEPTPTSSTGLASLGWTPAVAYADTPVDRPSAFEADRESPPAGRTELGFDGGAPLASWGASVSLGYLDHPLVLHTGDLTAVPIDHRETVAVGAAIAIADRVVFDVRIPWSHQIGDRFTALAPGPRLDRFVPGDLRLAARARINGSAGTAAFIRGELTLPTGDEGDLAGDLRYSLAWNLIGRMVVGPGVVIAATAGIRLRGAEVQVYDRFLGDELTGAAGVVVPIPPIANLWCKREQVKLTGELVGVLGDDVAGKRGSSPAEARVGVVTEPWPGLFVGVRAGTGLDDQIGSPRFRATLEISWQAPAPPPAPKSAEPEPEPESDEPD